MNADIAFAAASAAALVGVTALAIRGLWTAGKTAEQTVAAGYGAARMLAAQRTRTLRAPRGDRQARPLPADAMVTFAGEREAAGIDEVLQALDNDLVGLVPVKKKVQQIAALLLVDRARQKFGLQAPRPNLHMCFTGPPGTGKTTVALRMAELLHRLGYLEQGQLVHAMRDDLVGEYIGQTAPKTKRVLDRATGGVLFIDEAYYLHRAADSKDYGQEAIDILLQVMENERDKLVVILAGYKDRMDDFFGSNPGMGSRIAHHLDFAPYEISEMIAIGRLMLERARYYLSEGAEAALRDYIARRMQEPRFANARSVRNEIERARLRHAHRLASDPDRSWRRDDLMRIEPADILASDASSLLEDNGFLQCLGHILARLAPARISARVAVGYPGRVQLDDSPGCVVHLTYGQAEPVPEKPHPLRAGPRDQLFGALHLVFGGSGVVHGGPILLAVGLVVAAGLRGRLPGWRRPPGATCIARRAAWLRWEA